MAASKWFTVVHEYQLFRDAFSRVADKCGVLLTRDEWGIVTGSIDSAVPESVKKFTSLHDSFRHRVAAALSHDMRNPLSVIVTAARTINLAPSPQRSGPSRSASLTMARACGP